MPEVRPDLRAEPPVPRSAATNVGFLLEDEAEAQHRVEFDNALPLALRLHRDGRLAAANQLYRAILEVDPENADALQFSGILAQQSGESGKAATLIEQANAADPDYGDAYFNRGNPLRNEGGPQEANEEYCRSIVRKPERSEARQALGQAYFHSGQADEAERVQRQWLAEESDNPEPRHLLPTRTSPTSLPVRPTIIWKPHSSSF